MDIGTIEAALKLRDEASIVIKNFQKNLGGLTTTGREVGESLTRIGATMTAAFSLPFVAAVKSAKDFESAFANVVKTVGDFDVDAFGKLTEDAEAFRTELLDLSREIPETADKLANIAAIGGQFGIAKDDLLDFTDTVAKLGVAIDGIEAETAAAALAQISNVTGEGTSGIKKYADALVDLGNKGNSTEGEILEFAKRLAGAGSQAGLTGDQIFGLGAAMANVGLNAEAGGTAMSRLLSKMSQAGAEGAEASQKFADFAGRIDGTVASGENFARLFQNDAKKALELFFDGLSDAAAKGQNLNVILTDLGVNEVRQRDTMLRLAGAQGELAKQFGISAKAVQDGTALNEEARKKYATFDNQLQLFLNSVRLVAIEIGTPMIRALNHLLDALKPVMDNVVSLARSFAALPPAAQAVITGLGLAGGVAGVLLLLSGQVVRTISDLNRLIDVLKTLAGVQVVTSMANAASGMTAAGAAAGAAGRSTIILTDAWKAQIATAGAATTATTGLTGALGRAGLYGALLTVATAMQGINVAITKYLNPALNDAEAGAATLAGQLYGLGPAAGYAVEHFKELFDLLARAKRGDFQVPAVSFVPLAPKMFKPEDVKLPTAAELDALTQAPAQIQSRIEALKAAVANLSPSIRAQILEWKEWGQSTEDIAKHLRLNEDVVTAFIARNAAAAAQFRKDQKDNEVSSDAFSEAVRRGIASVEQQTSALQDLTGWDAAQKAAEDLRLKMRDLQDSLDLRRLTQGLSKPLAEAVTKFRETARAVEDLRKEAKDADPQLQDLYDSLVDLTQQNAAAEIGELVFQSDEFRAVLVALNPQMAQMIKLAEQEAEFTDAAEKKTRDWTHSLSGLADAFGNLKQVGGAVGFAAEMVIQADIALQSFGKVREGIKEFAKGAKADLVAAFSDMAAGIASGIAGVVGATDPSKDLGSRLLGGAIQGASLGASVGATIGGAIASSAAQGAAYGGAWGAAAGVIVGIMIAVFRGRATRREMEIVGEEWGTSISKGLYDKIKKAQDELFQGDRVAASIFNFSDILQEAGGLNNLNFDAFTAKLRDVFVMIETGQFTTEQALHVMAENFDAFANHVRQSGEFASKGFLELLKLNATSGLLSPEIIAFLTGNATTVGGGLAAMLGPVIEGAAKVGERVRDAQAALEALTKEGKEGTAEWLAATAELNEALRHQAEVATGAAGDIENIGIVALAAFTTAMEGGASFVEALNAIGPALDAILQAQKDLGVEGTNAAVNQLLHYRELANQFPQLVTAAAALNTTLVALQQMGGLNVESLAAMEDQGLRTFQRLRDAGFTENEALAQMAKFLGNIEKAHKALGVPIDANTQKLIDQAREAGFLAEEQVDATEQQRLGFEMLARGINRLIETLGGVPIAIDDISEAVDRIPKNVEVEVDVTYNPGEMPRYPGTGPHQTPTGYDPYGPDWDPDRVGAAAASAAEGASAGMTQRIVVQVGEDVIAEAAARGLPEELILRTDAGGF